MFHYEISLNIKNPSKIKILHVDDDPSIVEVSKQILETDNNFEVDNASSVDEAFRKLEKQSFDVVVSDYEMPLKNGLDFLSELREKKNKIPFILLTGRGREEVAIKALNLGADGYINKMGDMETVYGELAHCIRRSVEKRQMEQALQEGDIRLKKLSAQASGMLYQFMMRPDGTFCVPFTTGAIRKIFGCSPEDVREDFSPIAKVILPEDFDRVVNSIRYSAKHLTPWVCEYRVQIPSQEIRWMWGQSIPEKLADGGIIWHGYNVDVTERKNMEEALRLSETRYRLLFENSFDGVLLTKPDGTIIAANPQACRMLGMTEEELRKAGRSGIVVNDENLASALKERERTGCVVAELTFRRKDGTTFVGEVSSGVFTSVEGNIRTSVIIRDITDRKKAEEKLNRVMNQLVLVNEKMNVVGSLTRHDVRNKLCTMTGNVFLLKKKNGDQVDILGNLGKMEQACKEIDMIFNFAKMYEQLGIEELSYLNVEETLKEAMALFSDSFSLEVINDCHGLTLLADSLLRQLFYNLIDNSLKHGEKVTRARVYYEKEAEDKLILVYQDDGVGISALNKQGLFKEGFSTSGTSGYGLFLIKKMMEVYGWVIQENGEPGKGAKFTITIPKINQNGKENFQIAC